MLSAAALLIVAPLANQSQNVHASKFTTGIDQPGMINTYGVAPYADPKMHKKGGYRGSAGEMGIVLNYHDKKYGNVQGTANANYVHDHLLSGFLVRNGKIHGQPFEPVSLHTKLRNDN
ncbi:hypothetical protein [Lactobacillus sp. PSON]|uniref:hypothetical protein n=1 Tax=Lactobacillus sp. PSON TaxID=3455454 RepID=UPI004040FFF4